MCLPDAVKPMRIELVQGWLREHVLNVLAADRHERPTAS
jgi:hypothetical protein